MEVVCKEFPKD